MKYIRTKDGRIIDFEKRYQQYLNNPERKQKPKSRLNFFKILHSKEYKQADTIEELIMPGDLVRYDGLYMSWIEKDRGDEIRGIDMHLIPRKSVDMLWTPTGNDTECYPNFKLVASKEEEEGELELL